MQMTEKKLDPKFIEQVQRELLMTTDLKRADLLFVFGTRHGIPEFLAVIEDLWRRDMFSYALVTGGATLGDPTTEAAILRDGMVAFGVDPGRIMLEERATNTGENVTLSLPIIDMTLGLENVRSLIAVGKLFTSARYLMTLERHWPEVEKMLAPVHFHPHPPYEWHAHAESREKVLAEWGKLGSYKSAGMIASWPARSKEHLS